MQKFHPDGDKEGDDENVAVIEDDVAGKISLGALLKMSLFYQLFAIFLRFISIAFVSLWL
jgi:hypothetical protein